MKLTSAHYQHMKSAIEALDRQVLEQHYRDLEQESARTGKPRDPDKRMRWDVQHAAGLTRWICDEVYPYANDTHLDTSLRQIFRELGLPGAGSKKPGGPG